MAKDAEDLAAQAERIRDLRESKHLTQPEVADAVGVSLRGYQLWEAADSDPGPRNLKALAEYHDVTADYIAFGCERPRGETPNLTDALNGDELSRLETSIKTQTERVDALELAVSELVGLLSGEPGQTANLGDRLVKSLERAMSLRAREAGRPSRVPPGNPPRQEHRRVS